MKEPFVSVWSAVRIVLGTLVLGAFAFFRGAVHRKFGFRVSQVLAVLTLSQFHFLFYASRTLPNTFALALGETTRDPSLTFFDWRSFTLSSFGSSFQCFWHSAFGSMRGQVC